MNKGRVKVALGTYDTDTNILVASLQERDSNTVTEDTRTRSHTEDTQEVRSEAKFNIKVTVSEFDDASNFSCDSSLSKEILN